MVESSALKDVNSQKDLAEELRDKVNSDDFRTTSSNARLKPLKYEPPDPELAKKPKGEDDEVNSGGEEEAGSGAPTYDPPKELASVLDKSISQRASQESEPAPNKKRTLRGDNEKRLAALQSQLSTKSK